MLIRFWGVRGSTPTPQKENLGYGGNTACVELRPKSGALFIFDCGTGIRALGHRLNREFGRRPIRGLIFLSHYHWDHIQGIPFFLPLYHRANAFLFHSFPSPGGDVRRVLEGQMTNPYFPVDMSTMAAERRFFELAEGRVSYDKVAVSCRPLHHPQGCLGFRVEAEGKVVVYATDNEPGDAIGDRNLRELAQGADILIYDAQYTPEEYRKRKQTWGHSTWREGVRVVRDAGVKQLILFHHDPDHDDRAIDSILAQTRKQFRNTLAAFEGMVLKL